MLILALGFYFNRQPQATLMASGALSLSFGANKTWKGSTFVVLMATAFGLSIAAILGSLAGNSHMLYMAGAVLLTGFYIVISDINSSVGWIFLQSSIAFLVAGFFPGSLQQAADRAALMGIGSVLQIFSLGLFFQGLRFNRHELSSFKSLRFPKQLSLLNQHRIHLKWSITFGVIAMGLTIFIDRTISIQHSYWAEMTLLICLRNDYHESLLRVPARIMGTFIGGLAAGALSTYWQQPIIIVVAFLASALIAISMSYSLTPKVYAIFTFFITMMIIFMLSSISIAQGNIAEQRMEATLLGGIMALASVVLTKLVTYQHINQARQNT
ncbi:FUSC family protein [Serratia sp. M24T3]|uniref:FUSC family protein n=1 Tax=Serratia sp. M24T3 TaxID=932213 RepID=UPI00025B9C04|nr:FUSC family protein [Serratia sp. M24T3]EIC83831.1 hypothetical protein SPM24T3_14776 [Serratia sp. M24T3]